MAFVLLELGALVGGNRVFQDQRMQPQFIAQASDGVAVGRFEFDPEKTPRLADMIADVVECNRLGA
jgi:hypothetical protein